MALIYIVDLETTGLFGGPHDLVVDIGICTFDTNTYKIEDIYSSHLGYDLSVWSDKMLNAWIFTHEGSELSLDDVDVTKGCRPADEVMNEVREILNGQFVTSYNTNFDLFRFLLKEPWYLNIRVAPDILKSARAYMHMYYNDAHDAKLQTAYDWILGGKDPAEICGLEKHLGLPDARMASHVLRKLWQNGFYHI